MPTFTVNGTSYNWPEINAEDWGTDVNTWAQAVSNHTLQKSGGSFTLTAEVDFGATYGLRAAYFRSKGTNPASAGAVRLANAENISWRNAANSADLALTVNSSNKLEFNGVAVEGATPGAADTVLQTNAAGTATEWGKVTNDNVDSSAAIAHSKMAALTASRAMVTDGSGVASASSVTATELGYVSGVTSALQTQLDAKQPLDSDLTAVAGLSSTGLVARTGSGTAAARTLTAGSSKVSVTNGDGVSGNPTVDVTEANLTHDNIGGTLGIAKGGTGQTTQTAAFDALAPTTTKGDLIVSNGTDNIRLAVGSDGQVLTADSGETSGLSWTSPLTNPMDSTGDMIIGGASGAATKLDAGTDGQFLVMTSGSPAWSTLNATSSAPGLVSREDTGSFTATLGAVSGTVTQTWYYTRMGRQVTIEIPATKAFTKDGTTSAVTASGFPASTLPSTTVGASLMAINYNGNASVGSARMGTGGLTLYRSGADDTFAAGTSNALIACTFTYFIR